MPRAARAPRSAPAAFAARPYPTEDVSTSVLGADGPLVVYRPAPDVAAWIRRVFIETVPGAPDPSPVLNLDHAHLATARIGVLWTNGEHRRRGMPVFGTAEIPRFEGNAWQRGRQAQHLRQLFPEFDGDLPDFVLTFDAPRAAIMDDAGFCALVEHELYHCAQKVGRDGPMFSRETGCPVWDIRGHDVEEFVGVVRRYGARAAGPMVRAMVEAASQWEREPVFSPETLAGVCGTCQGTLSRGAATPTGA